MVDDFFLLDLLTGFVSSSTLTFLLAVFLSLEVSFLAETTLERGTSSSDSEEDSLGLFPLGFFPFPFFSFFLESLPLPLLAVVDLAKGSSSDSSPSSPPLSSEPELPPVVNTFNLGASTTDTTATGATTGALAEGAIEEGLIAAPEFGGKIGGRLEFVEEVAALLESGFDFFIYEFEKE